MSRDPSLDGSLDGSLSGSGEALRTTMLGEPTPDEEAKVEAPKLDRGAHLGRYTVLERIGAGGMGVVYGAFDPQLDRKIALKVMHPNMRTQTATDGGRSRLLREAQAMAKLSHANVITVHDVGMFGDRVFVAMEFVDGVTLREWLEQQHRDWPEIVEGFVKAGRGLASAHAAGLVHRDFKPDNVLIGRDGRVLVMDFGLARTAGGPELPSSSHPGTRITAPQQLVLTRTGALLGTPAYMAPEQHKGGKPAPHADQFSFCVALYEALYGERPFAGTSVTSLAMNVLDGRVRPPPKNSGVPTWLRDVVVRGLSTEPSDRWPSMDALLAELQRDPEESRPPWIMIGSALGVGSLITVAYLASRPPVDDRCADAASAIDQTWDDTRRDAVSTALAQSDLAHAPSVSQAIDAAMADWVERWQEQYLDVCRVSVKPAPRGPDPSEVPALLCLEQQRQQTEALADAVADASTFGVLQGPWVIDAMPDPAACADGGELVATDLSPSARQREIRAKLAAANARLPLRQPHRALELVDGLASGAQALDDPGLQATVLLTRARAHRAVGELRQAENELQEAVLLSGRTAMPRLESQLWIELADLVGHARDRSREGMRLLLAAQTSLARAGQPADLEAALELTRGRIRASTGRFDEATDAFARAKSRLEMAGRVGGPTLAELDSLLGLGKSGVGRYESAMESHSEALETREALFGSQHRLVGVSLAELGSAMLGADYPRKADASFVRARWVLDQPVRGQQWPPISADDPDGALLHAKARRDLAAVEDRAGLAHRAKEEFAEAEAAHRRALELLERELGPEHRDLGYALNNLGLALADQGRHRESLDPLHRAVKVWSATLPTNHPDLAVAHLNVANSLWAAGQFVEARMEYDKALDVWEHSLPPDHPLLGYALTGVGRCALASDDSATAVEHLERALTIRDNENEDRLNLAETQLALGQALWAEQRDPTRARELAASARDLVAAYEPSDPAGIDALLGGAEVPFLTDQLVPAGLGTVNRNPSPDR